MITLSRRYRFPASHRLHLLDRSEAENTALFGKCNNPFGHGHDYTLTVTVAGEADPITGLIVPIGELDRFVGRHVLELFAFRNINLDVPQFENLVPTTENVAHVISKILELEWPNKWEDKPVHLVAVHVQETDRNGFEVRLQSRQPKRMALVQNESVLVNA